MVLSPFGSRRATIRGHAPVMVLPTRPSGWPVAAFPNYAEAQQAVDYMADRQFPVDQMTIVGVDLMQVERVAGRLTWPKVLGVGAVSGAWLGLLVGLVVSIFAVDPVPSVLAGVLAGVTFGVITAAIPYGITRDARDFSSTCSWLPSGTTCCVTREAASGQATCRHIFMTQAPVGPAACDTQRRPQAGPLPGHSRHRRTRHRTTSKPKGIRWPTQLPEYANG